MTPGWRGSAAAVLGASLAADALLGEPPEAVHPVAWMGRATGWAIPADADPPRRLSLLRGAAAIAAGAGTSWLAWQALTAASRRPRSWGARTAAEALTLWPLLALRGLLRAAGRVADALVAGDLGTAREHLRWLVGRELAGLDLPLLASAAVESLAENLADSVVAPLLYARVGGPPAAALHRFANTADAMRGYRDGYDLGGRAAARLDDLLGLAPSRLAAAAIVVGAPAGGGAPGGALAVWRRDAAVTASPNAGRPMAAMAGALDCRLEKRDHHVLNRGGRDCAADDIGRASRIVVAASLATLAALGAVPAGRRACHGR